MSRAQATILFAIVGLSAAYFYQAGGWNQNSRLDLTRALVEQRTARIDALHGNTGDKARYQGAYYCDKAPGTSWLAVPWYAAVRLLAGGRLSDERFLALASYVATLGAVALPAAAAAVAVAWIAGWLGVSLGWQLGLALAYALGTLAFPYATLFYGHQPAAALLIGGFALMAGTRHAAWRPLPSLLAAGGLLGAGVTVEYSALLAAGVLLGYAALTVRPGRYLLALAAGLLPPLLLLAAYHAAAFGSPFTLPYEYSTQTHRHAGFFMGLGWPDRAALWGILGSGYRGLFFSAPWLLLGLPGAWALIRRRQTRPEGAACTLIIVLFVWLNASLVDWQGGSALGPRYLVPALPFLALAAAGALRPLPPASRWRRVRALVVPAAMVASALLMLVGTAVQPEVSMEMAHPWSGFLGPRFLDGQLALNHTSFAEYLPGGQRRAWNLGMRGGLHGLTSLLPLLALWGLAGMWARALTARADARE